MCVSGVVEGVSVCFALVLLVWRILVAVVLLLNNGAAACYSSHLGRLGRCWYTLCAAAVAGGVRCPRDRTYVRKKNTVKVLFQSSDVLEGIISIIFGNGVQFVQLRDDRRRWWCL